MKYAVVFVMFFFICQVSFGRGWYFNTLTGNDTTGIGTIGSPYRSITKLNAIFSTFTAGDSVCFFGGQTFYGSIRVNKNGTNGNPIKITSYGTGRATISGFTAVGGWTLSTPNIYVSSAVPGNNVGVSMVTKDDDPLGMGRYPNANAANGGYLVYDVGTPLVSIISRTALPFNPTGASLCQRKIADVLGRELITSVSGNTINYTNLTGSGYPGYPGYGFFIENAAATLDVQNEWYLPPSRQLQMYSTTTPTGIKMATIDTLLFVSANDYITISNLNFDGADKAAIDAGGPTVGNCANLIIQDVTITNSGRDAIYVANTNNLFVNRLRVYKTMNNGVVLSSEGGRNVNCIFTNDTLVKIGYIAGMGFFNFSTGFKASMEGITNGSNPVAGEIGMKVKFCSIDTVGHIGVRFYQNNTNIDSNHVNYYCFITDDAGAINTFGNFQPVVETNRTVVGNLVTNGIGAPFGAAGSVVNGIYVDDGADGGTISGNSIGSVNGIGVYIHNGNNWNIQDNIIFNGTYSGVGVVNDNHATTIPIRNIACNRNLVFAKSNSSLFLVTRTYDTLVGAVYNTLNNNRYCRPTLITSNTIQSTSAYNSSPQITRNYTLATWKSAYSGAVNGPYDAATTEMGTNPNASDFVYNASNRDSVLNFPGLSYLVLQYNAPYQVTYDNSMPLKAHQGYVRIANGTATPINKFPVANAGANQTITLPTNSATLLGTGSDSDGVIVSYAWVQLSGPNTATITPNFSTTTGTTNVSGLIGGTYQFQLTVTDNNGATGTATTRVTVNVPANVPPTANAGVDQSVTLPTSTATLTGSGNDPDGTIVSYAWVKISGPTGGTITSPSSATTTVTSLQAGTYTYQLTVTDNGGLTGSDLMNIVVNPANIAPVANAGSDITLTLPDSSAILLGSGTDADGTIVSYLWTKISGPAGGSIAVATDSSTAVTNLRQGTYVYRLLVTDNNGATGVDFMQIVVNPAVPPINIPPTANAGADQFITLPTSTTTLVGSGTDSDGSIVSYLWRKISGSTGGAITSSTSATTGITGLTAGSYVYQLRVTDNNGDTATDAMQVTVNPANQLPTVNAGANQIITLPTNSTTLTGTASDPDGTIASYQWMKISGPTGGTISSPSTASTGITALQQGVYIYELKVLDNSGDSAVSSVQITVNAAPIIVAPTANAGTDSTVQLPNNTVHLLGSGTNGTGTIVSHLWTVFSGPTGSSFTDATQYNVTVSGLVEGTYLFQLSVTDNNSLIGTDLVQVVVRAEIIGGIKVLFGYGPIAN